MNDDLVLRGVRARGRADPPPLHGRTMAAVPASGSPPTAFGGVFQQVVFGANAQATTWSS